MPFTKDMLYAAIFNWRLAYLSGECASIEETDVRLPEHVARETTEQLWAEASRLQIAANAEESKYAIPYK